MPIDVGHRVTNGLTEMNYTDCGNVNNRYYAVTMMNDEGESDPSNEAQAEVMPYERAEELVRAQDRLAQIRDECGYSARTPAEASSTGDSSLRGVV